MTPDVSSPNLCSLKLACLAVCITSLNAARSESDKLLVTLTLPDMHGLFKLPLSLTQTEPLANNDSNLLFWDYVAT